MGKYLHRAASCIAAILIAAGSHTASATDFGFCTGSVERTNIFRLGTSEKQGLAIRLAADKLALFKGRTVSAVSVAVGSKRVNGGTIDLFIATAPDAEPLVAQTVTVSAATRWLTFDLETPYTITGDEPCLYVGYTGSISAASSMLMADFTADSERTTYGYRDGEWVDLYGTGHGNASIRLGIDDAPALTDIMVKPINADGYYVAGRDYALAGQLFNFGTETVTAFDLAVSVAGGEPQKTAVGGVSIAPGETYDFTLPVWRTDVAGNVGLSIVVDNVNGAADADASDNIFERDIFCYPVGMERSILLETFTGQACGNCPKGHTLTHEFLATATTTPVIEVMHHSGYQPDYFTMNADMDFTYFYGSASTYAPALMMNRTTTVGSVPVMNTSTENLQYSYDVLEATQPYVSLALATTFDEATREVGLTLDLLVHNDLPSERNIFNLMLIQDNLVSKQSPYGDNYQHNAVCRGVLTASSWGVAFDPSAYKAGSRYSWTRTFTLPEAIVSDFESGGFKESERTWPAVAADMHIVAYVAAYGDTPGDNRVYNAVSVPLGQSHVQAGYANDVARPVAVGGERAIYTLNGTRLRSDVTPAPGVYLVRQDGQTRKVRIQ